jgi:hypothetical protein
MSKKGTLRLGLKFSRHSPHPCLRVCQRQPLGSVGSNPWLLRNVDYGFLIDPSALEALLEWPGCGASFTARRPIYLSLDFLPG